MAVLSSIPELSSVREAIARCREAQSDLWEAVKSLSRWEVYTDGSAPIKNPGGPIGFSSVFLVNGHAWEVFGGTEGRTKEPPTSNNRAEIAGVLTILEVLYTLSTSGESLPREIEIVCDSQYVVHCAQGKWKKHKNRDLWQRFDQLMCVARQKKVRVQFSWTRAHVGTEWNERADVLAKDGAFLAMGRLPPPSSEGVADTDSTAGPLPKVAEQACQYVLGLYSQMGGGATAEAHYRLATGARERSESFSLDSVKTLDEAEYQALIRGLEDLLSTLEKAERDPADFSLAVQSCRDLMLKQMQGLYGVKSERLQPLYQRALTLVRRFGRVEWTQHSKTEAREMFQGQPFEEREISSDS